MFGLPMLRLYAIATFSFSLLCIDVNFAWIKKYFVYGLLIRVYLVEETTLFFLHKDNRYVFFVWIIMFCHTEHVG